MGNFIARVFEDSYDMPAKLDPNNPAIKRLIKARDEMTGWDRVKMVFSQNEFGEITPELHRCMDATLIATVVGAMMGGIGRSRIAYMDFFRQNTHTQFQTPLTAKRALSDKVILGMGSGAFRIGWRLSAFTFMYMTTSTAIAAYRGKVGVIDQVGGAGLAGFLYKLRDGPKAAVSGTIFGSLLGLMAGTITLAAVKLVGMDLESANMMYYHRLSLKQENEHKKTLILRQTSEDVSNLQKFHDSLYAATEPQQKTNIAESVPHTPVIVGSTEKSEQKPSVQVQTKTPS